jgi:hypothetical protein
MARGNYTGRTHMLYFKSERDRKSWIEAANNAGEPVSKYIIEMAKLGLAKRERPKDDPLETARLREEVVKLQSRNRDLETIRENNEAEILKLRHRAFLQPPTDKGSRTYSRMLVDLLQGGGTWSGRDILKALHVSSTDSEAVDIVLNQLHGLEYHGLVEESVRGWRWSHATK